MNSLPCTTLNWTGTSRTLRCERERERERARARERERERERERLSGASRHSGPHRPVGGGPGHYTSGRLTKFVLGCGGCAGICISALSLQFVPACLNETEHGCSVEEHWPSARTGIGQLYNMSNLCISLFPRAWAAAGQPQSRFSAVCVAHVLHFLPFRLGHVPTCVV